MNEIDQMLEFLATKAQEARQEECRYRAEAHICTNGTEQEIMAITNLPETRKTIARKLKAMAIQAKAQAEMFDAIGITLIHCCRRRRKSQNRMLETDKGNSRK